MSTYVSCFSLLHIVFGSLRVKYAKMVKNWKKLKMSLLISVFLYFKGVFLKFTSIPFISVIRTSSVQKN